MTPVRIVVTLMILLLLKALIQCGTPRPHLPPRTLLCAVIRINLGRLAWSRQVLITVLTRLRFSLPRPAVPTQCGPFVLLAPSVLTNRILAAGWPPPNIRTYVGTDALQNKPLGRLTIALSRPLLIICRWTSFLVVLWNSMLRGVIVVTWLPMDRSVTTRSRNV